MVEIVTRDTSDFQHVVLEAPYYPNGVIVSFQDGGKNTTPVHPTQNSQKKFFLQCSVLMERHQLQTTPEYIIRISGIQITDFCFVFACRCCGRSLLTS